jgi:methyl-accepting chemotaxis protein
MKMVDVLLGSLFWQPAKLLMRRLRFASKMGLTLVAMLLSAAWLAWQATPVVGVSLAWGVWTLGLAVSAYLGVGFYLSNRGGLKALRRHMLTMSMGDLRTDIQASGNDEITSLLRELGRMQASLQDTVRMVLDSSSEVVNASVEIAAGTHDLSARVESAAASLEQSSAALEQSTSTTAHTAESVAKASELALNNAVVAQRGGEVVRDVVTTMERIQVSSNKISDIIGVIDGIAFQTNILALNAAVEAARAGEQGKGFAVVAGEVRSLAQRTATAAHEIKDLINTSVIDVNHGVKVVRGAGDAMQDIVTNADEVRHLMEEVARAAQEQNQGIAQIGLAIQELDQNTQANAALVEEAAAAATNQQSAAIRMAAMVDEFRLPGGGRSTVSRVDGLDVDIYIDAHRQWKVKLRDAIEARDKVDVDTLKRDDCCALGKWIYADGQKRYGSSASFVELVSNHANFHRVAGSVAETINAQHFREAEDALAPGTPFSNATRNVVRVLSTIKRLGF